ncbi:chemotaxis protein MotD [Aquamicrobium terrae]
MTTIVGPNIPETGMASRAAPRASAGEADDASAFGEMLAGRGTRGKDAEPAPADDEDAGAAQAAPVRSRAGRTAGDAPLRDRFPLMSALQRLPRHPETADDEKTADADDETAAQVPAPDGNADATAAAMALLAQGSTGQSRPAATAQGPARRDRAETQRTRPDTAGVQDADAARTSPQDRQAAGPGMLQSGIGRGPVLPGMDAARPQVQAVSEVPGPPSGQAGSPDEAAPLQRGAVRLAPATRVAALQQANVVAEQSFPAPAPYALSRSASQLVGAMTSDPGWRQAAAASATALQPAATVTSAAHALKIELHPAELGSVTASLRMAGQQLSIEVRPETHEAYRKLSADSEAIVKSLRGLGFDIDRVTVLQPSLAATPAARADAAGHAGMQPGRDQPSFQAGSNGGGAGAEGQQWRGERHDDGQDGGRTAPQLRERAGGGLFI